MTKKVEIYFWDKENVLKYVSLPRIIFFGKIILKNKLNARDVTSKMSLEISIDILQADLKCRWKFPSTFYWQM